MVAIRRNEPARNLVRTKRTAPTTSSVALELVEGRTRPRVRVALAAWLCAETGSIRGYALDLSADGARFGGMGRTLVAGKRVLAKIVLANGDAPLVLRAEVVRYANADVCVKFLDGPSLESVEEQCRLRAFLASIDRTS